jgi:hypothetical protein
MTLDEHLHSRTQHMKTQSLESVGESDFIGNAVGGGQSEGVSKSQIQDGSRSAIERLGERLE